MDSAERAARAVREFQKMVPGLTSYVRAMTGNQKLRVRAHPVTSTDGEHINIRPPLALAEPREHDRRLCDARDENVELLCPACNRMEQVWACLYHEMSHIVSGSLDMYLRKDLRAWVTRGALAVSDKYSALIERNLKKWPVTGRDTVYDIAVTAHPYLTPILRATDDYVIEQRAFAARPGVQTMIYAMTAQIMRKGIEQDDGSFEKWCDQPVEVQLPVALLDELHGWRDEGWFSDEAVRALNAPGVQALMRREMSTVPEALSAAAAYLGEFIRLGYYQTEESHDESHYERSESAVGGPDADAGPAGGSAAGGSAEDRPGDDEVCAAPAAEDPGAGGNRNAPDADPGDPSGSADGDGGGLGAAPGGIPDHRELERDAEPDRDGDISDADPVPDDGDAATGGAGQAPGGEVNEPETGDAGGSGDPVDPVAGPGAGEPDPARAEGDGDFDAGARARGSGDPAGDGAGHGDAAGGTRVAAPPPEQVEAGIGQASGHERNHAVLHEGYDYDAATGAVDPDAELWETSVGREQMDIAVIQAVFFDAPSWEVGKVVLHKDGQRNHRRRSGLRQQPNESMVSGTIHRARRVFSDNRLDKHVSGLKKGKLSPRNLGARGWSDDTRVFRKKIRADATDYEVVIGVDVSGSTAGGRLAQIKKAAWSMAEVLWRIGVPFSLIAHTTGDFDEVIDQELYEIKALGAPWNDAAKQRLADLYPDAGSLDGHNFEFYRKMLMRSQAKKRLCVYFTDGNIPETNHIEERMIMEREASLYKRLGLEALIVAVHVELPDAYGFDQVKLDEDQDIKAVLDALEKKLTEGKKWNRIAK